MIGELLKTRIVSSVGCARFPVSRRRGDASTTEVLGQSQTLPLGMEATRTAALGKCVPDSIKDPAVEGIENAQQRELACVPDR